MTSRAQAVKSVAVVADDPNSPAAEHGGRTGDAVLDVGGKAVVDTADVRKAVGEARTSGRRNVLMRVKTANGNIFVAIPVGKG